MKEKQLEILKTNKIEIFYHKSTGDFLGAGFLDGLKVNEKLTKKVSNKAKEALLSSFVNKQSSNKNKVDSLYEKKEKEDILKEIDGFLASTIFPFSAWLNFIENHYDYIKVINGELVGEYRIIPLEEKKGILIKIRQNYLEQTSNMYGHDWTLAPQEVIEKRNLALQEIDEIKIATNLDNYTTEF